MWRGIELQPSSNAKIIASTIENAEYGIHVSDKTWLSVEDSYFNADYTGIYVEPYPGFHTLYNFDIRGSRFDCSSSTLISPYSGQVNILGAISKAGIELNHCNVSIDGGLNVNNFTGLSNGIISNESNTTINNCYFENIYPDPVYSTSWNGSGIYSHGSSIGSLFQIGFGGTQTSSPSFLNCYYGINAEKCELMSVSNNMKNMIVGVRAYGVHGQGLAVNDLHITCSLYGIESQYNDFASSISFSNDIIELDDQSSGQVNGAGIFVNEYSLAGSGNQKQINYPFITVVHGKHGILLQNCNGFDVYGGGSTTNVFAVSPNDCYQGVSVYGGEKNRIQCMIVDFSMPGDKLSSSTDFAFNNTV